MKKRDCLRDRKFYIRQMSRLLTENQALKNSFAIDQEAEPEEYAWAMKSRKKWAKRVKRTWKKMRKRGVFDDDSWIEYIENSKGNEEWPCWSILLAMHLGGLECKRRERERLAEPMDVWSHYATLTGDLRHEVGA